jgi:hypothetical protein
MGEVLDTALAIALPCGMQQRQVARLAPLRNALRWRLKWTPPHR